MKTNGAKSDNRGAGLKNLLLVDDHTIVREGLKRVLEPITHEWAITEAGTGYQALERMQHLHFSMVVVDLSLPGMSGLELIRRIKCDHPTTTILVLSMHAEEQYAMRAFKAGANGYVTKDTAASELVTAVRKAASGGAYISSNLAEQVVLQMNGGLRAPRHAELSNRELEVLQRIVAGERLVDIALALHLSVKTVSTHKTRIQDKLQLPSMAALIRYGLEHQIGDGEMEFTGHQNRKDQSNGSGKADKAARDNTVTQAPVPTSSLDGGEI